MTIFGTDIGPACSCGGTIYEYHCSAEDPGYVVVRCVTCNKGCAVGVDTSEPLTVSIIRARHEAWVESLDNDYCNGCGLRASYCTCDHEGR